MKRQTPHNAKRHTNETKQRTPVTGRRLWLFRLITVLILPVLLILLFEVTLRVCGFGFSPETLIGYEMDGKAWLHENPKFGWRFFPPRMSRSFAPFACVAEKPDDLIRVVVLGASAAQGVPDHAYGFGRVLEVMLNEALAPKRAEVMVAAMPAINSHVVLKIAQDCATLKPDAYVIYLGNNEVVGPYGAGTVFSPLSGNIELIRANIAVKGTRIGQLVTQLSSTLIPNNTPTVWQGLEMFVNKQVRQDDPAMEILYRHFQRNMEDILAVTQRQNAKILLCTVGSNLRDCAPFSSLHKIGLSPDQLAKWQTLYDSALAKQQAGEYEAAGDGYAQALVFDDRYADLHFGLARCYEALGDPAQALTHYVKARDLDTLRLRADTRINEIIRQTAQTQTGIHLVDTEQALAQASSQGITNQTQFYEHVHLTFSGNYTVASTVFSQLVPLLHPDQANTTPLSQSECATRLAYTAWDHMRITDKIVTTYMKRPPFTQQVDHDQQIAERQQGLATLKQQVTPAQIKNARQIYEQALAQRPQDMTLRWKYSELLDEGLNLQGLAVQQYVQIEKVWPHFSDVYAKHGLALGKMGQLNKTIALNQEALSQYPYNPLFYYNIGFAYHVQGQIDKALANYTQALALNPDFAQAWNNAGILYFEKGQQDKAIQILKEGQQKQPGDLDLFYNLGIVYQRMGRVSEAKSQFQHALTLNPSSDKTRQALRALP